MRGVLTVFFIVLVCILALLARVVEKTYIGGAPERSAFERPAPTDIPWPGADISRAAAAAARRFVTAHRVGFGPAGETERAELAAADTGLRPDQLLALRDTETTFLSQTGGVRALQLGSDLAAEHARGATVLDLAKKYDLPPLAIAKQLLLETRYDAPTVRRLLREPTALPPRLAAELPAILAADLSSAPNQMATAAAAAAFERSVAARLRKLGVRFRTEDELKERGAALTPDILLTTPVRINGHPVHWIDAKNYMWYGSRLTATSLARQAMKYAAAFGPGAMVFRAGAVRGLRLGMTGPQPLMLGWDDML